MIKHFWKRAGVGAGLAGLLIVGGIYCQTNKPPVTEKEITDAKGVALCTCFSLLNRIDSLSIMNKDVSGSYFVEFSTLSVRQFGDIYDFVEKNIDSFYTVPWQTGHNMITYTCWSLYESNTLDSFVKTLLKKGTNGQ